MDLEEKIEVGNFLKVGIIVLSCLVVFGLGIQYVSPNVSMPVSQSVQRELPIYCVDTTKKEVALTFDAAWGNDDTGKILEVLKKNQINVTFFMTGGWIETYPEDVKAIKAAGHDLGNHSENHKQMSKLTKEECKKELTTPHNKVKQLVSYDMTLFRPPFGDYNNTLIQSARELGYSCIQWDVDSLDWKDYSAKQIVRNIMDNKHLGNGSIILMHNGGKHTLEALPIIIESLKTQGYTIVPVSKLIYKENFKMDQEGRQHLNK